MILILHFKYVTNFAILFNLLNNKVFLNLLNFIFRDLVNRCYGVCFDGILCPTFALILGDSVNVSSVKDSATFESMLVS